VRNQKRVVAAAPRRSFSKQACVSRKKREKRGRTAAAAAAAARAARAGLRDAVRCAGRAARCTPARSQDAAWKRVSRRAVRARSVPRAPRAARVAVRHRRPAARHRLPPTQRAAEACSAANPG
jgi:hypothetical protein